MLRLGFGMWTRSDLGFRHDGTVLRHLVMGWALHGKIEAVLCRECRHGPMLIESGERKTGWRRRAKKSQRRQPLQG
jgi:hypothetical protein